MATLYHPQTIPATLLPDKKVTECKKALNNWHLDVKKYHAPGELASCTFASMLTGQLYIPAQFSAKLIHCLPPPFLWSVITVTMRLHISNVTTPWTCHMDSQVSVALASCTPCVYPMDTSCMLYGLMYDLMSSTWCFSSTCFSFILLIVSFC